MTKRRAPSKKIAAKKADVAQSVDDFVAGLKERAGKLVERRKDLKLQHGQLEEALEKNRQEDVAIQGALAEIQQSMAFFAPKETIEKVDPEVAAAAAAAEEAAEAE